eukprot:Pgem_evm1s8852
MTITCTVESKAYSVPVSCNYGDYGEWSNWAYNSCGGKSRHRNPKKTGCQPYSQSSSCTHG